MMPEEQAARNISLLGRQLEHFLDHPEELAGLDGQEIVLIPTDDPELAAANEALAGRLKVQSSDGTPSGLVRRISA